MRWISAAAFAGLMTVAIYVIPEGWIGHHETVWTASLVGVYFVAGALIGRWWALVLAFVPVLLTVPLGDQGDVDGTPVWWWVLVDTCVIFAWVMLAGVLIGALLRRRRRGSSHAAAGR